MKGRRTRGILFVFWLLLATLSTSWIFFSVLNDIKLILSELVYQFVFVISCLGFIIAVLSLHVTLTEVKSKINEEREKQKNVRDFYQYTQLLDPSSMNN